MDQQKLREWILKQPYFSLNAKYDGMTAWELAGIIIREGAHESKKVIKIGNKGETYLTAEQEKDLITGGRDTIND